MLGSVPYSYFMFWTRLQNCMTPWYYFVFLVIFSIRPFLNVLEQSWLVLTFRSTPQYFEYSMILTVILGCLIICFNSQLILLTIPRFSLILSGTPEYSSRNALVCYSILCYSPIFFNITCHSFMFLNVVSIPLTFLGIPKCSSIFLTTI